MVLITLALKNLFNALLAVSLNISFFRHLLYSNPTLCPTMRTNSNIHIVAKLTHMN